MPPTCRESLARALTCTGATPRYYTPSSGPLALAWDWLFLGVLLGLLFRRAAAAMVALQACAPCSRHALLRELLAHTQDRHRHEVLDYLLQGPSKRGSYARVASCCKRQTAHPQRCWPTFSPTAARSPARRTAAAMSPHEACVGVGRHMALTVAQASWGSGAPWVGVQYGDLEQRRQRAMHALA